MHQLGEQIRRVEARVALGGRVGGREGDVQVTVTVAGAATGAGAGVGVSQFLDRGGNSDVRDLPVAVGPVPRPVPFVERTRKGAKEGGEEG